MVGLDCKGYTEILVRDIEQIDGLTIQKKVGDDIDLYEIAGIPLNDLSAQTDYALALARISGPAHRVSKHSRR